MSKFCPECGTELPDDALFCASCGCRMPDMSPAEEVSEPAINLNYTRFTEMVKAAETAIDRNGSGEWSYWDSPEIFDYSPGKLMKFCEKEDKRLTGDEDRPVYFVSVSGALGQVYTEEGTEYLEWLFYTETEGPDELPKDVSEL